MPSNHEISTPAVSAALQAELAKILVESCNTRFGLGLLEALDSSDPALLGPAAMQLHEFGERIREFIVKDDNLPGHAIRFIRRDNGGSGFYPAFVGNALVRRAMERCSPEAAIDWLIKILTTKTATGKTIQALWGVSVDQEIQLTSAVRLIPIEHLPESKNKRQIMEGGHLGTYSFMSMLHFQPASSALIAERVIDPLIVDENYDFKSCNAEAIRTSTLLREIALVLTAVGPRAAIPSIQWFEFDDPDLEAAGFTSTSGNLLEILPLQLPDYPLLDVNVAPRIVQAYLNMDGEDRRKLRVALQRLNQAQRRHTVGDRAVELSTAFETLVGDNSKSEMTHKVKVRTVRILGGSRDVRARNAAIMSRAYAIRSQLVHAGINATKPENVDGQKLSPTEIIDQATVICADLIKTFLSRGSIPSWPDFDVQEPN